VRRTLISRGGGETRIAVLVDDALRGYEVEHEAERSRVGDIRLGRISRVLPKLDAAFVACGLARPGYLPLADMSLHEGQAMIVQVVKDAFAEKAAKLTAKPNLTGSGLTYRPLAEGVQVSRQAGNRAARHRLAEAAGAAMVGVPGGLVVEGDFESSSITALVARWQAIAVEAETGKPPVLLARGPCALERALAEGGEVIVDDLTLLGGAARLHAGPETLFQAYGIEADIEALSGPEIRLPSGGRLTIEQTRALCAIDVDSGESSDGRGGDLALATNLEAAAALAGQLVLRNIAGLVAVDFIAMTSDTARQELTEALTDAVAADPLPVSLAPISRFGVIELTRKRTRNGLQGMLSEPCPHCAGRGHLPSRRTVAAAVLRAAHRESAARPGRPIALRVAPEVAALFDGELRESLEALKRAVAATVSIEMNTSGEREQFEVISQ
jgi:ribonuclease G